VKPAKRGFLFFPFLEQSKCKFSRLCGCFSESSFTCTHEGGSYCGKYRALSGKPKENVETGVLEREVEEAPSP